MLPQDEVLTVLVNSRRRKIPDDPPKTTIFSIGGGFIMGDACFGHLPSRADALLIDPRYLGLLLCFTGSCNWILCMEMERAIAIFTIGGGKTHCRKHPLNTQL